MDRTIVYPGQIPLEMDILSSQRHAMIALGGALLALTGGATAVSGLGCAPTSPASMQVQVAPGVIFAPSTVDATAFSTLAADTRALFKVGQNLDAWAATLAAPGVAGQSINYLIEASLVEADGSPVVLPYYNAANPSVGFTGPNNSAVAQNTRRTQRVGLQVKAGAAAATGTQVTPATDAGCTPLWVVTVNNGQTTITAGSITQHPQAPFLGFGLPQLTPGFSRLAVLTAASGQWTVPPAFGGQLRCKITMAGGGGGGVAGSSAQAGSGGGAGGFGFGIYTLPSGGVCTYGAGAGGAGGLPGDQGDAGSGLFGGRNGGASTFYYPSGALLMSSPGGSTGVRSTATAAGGSGGAPPTGAQFACGGGNGSDGSPAANTKGGDGAAGPWGGGARAGVNTPGAGNALAPGNAFGAGGGGSYGANPGTAGAGAAGVIIVEY